MPNLERLPLVVCMLMCSIGSTACAPFLVFPGGALRGAPAPHAVEDWGATDEVEFVQIETRPDRPYSVQVYGVGAGDAFYIASQGWRGALGSPGRARWIDHLADDPRIRLRVGETIHALQAIRVDDRDEIDRVRQLFVAKYGEAAESWGFWRQDGDAGGSAEAFVYRLAPR